MKTHQFIAEHEVLCSASRLISTIAEGPRTSALFEQARRLCHHPGSDEGEILEHWIVSDWLAKKLAASGETIDEDFAGMAIWGRTTHGQAIAADDVIIEICTAIKA